MMTKTKLNRLLTACLTGGALGFTGSASQRGRIPIHDAKRAGRAGPNG